MAGTVLKDLLRGLRRDSWRDSNPFSEDVATANAVLLHPFASDGQRSEALSSWLQENQPCLFGRIAAATNLLHYCVLTDVDLQESDESVQEKIRRELVAWKRRSLRPASEYSLPAHGFVLSVASERVALAAPDENLYRFACKLRDLWGCASTSESTGEVHWETLYLENPRDGTYVKFTFSVDFFAAQGDRRWWHDHRVPGGLAFTANSAGHMRRYREWYKGSKDQREWLLKTAMETIHRAADTPYGKATWLRALSGGQPFVPESACPFAEPDRLKPDLWGKDWTRYAGHLHTDHSIRNEFFSENPAKAPDISGSEWLQDFTYLFDAKKRDYVRFVAGQTAAYDEIVAELGSPEDYEKIVSPAVKSATVSLEDRLEVETLLEKCRRWKLSPERLESLDA